MDRSGPRDSQWTKDEIKAMEAENAPPYILNDLRKIKPCLLKNETS